MKNRICYVLLVVLALAALLRWFRFTTFPPGLWYDEAYTLVEAQELRQSGEFHIYYPEKHGEPAMFWLTALALGLGAGHLAPRWVAATTSIGGILLLFFAARDILRHETRQAEWLALGGAAALGINYACLFNSRMGWEASLGMPVFIPAVWLFWRGMRDGRSRDFVLAGLMLGASQYTCVSARLLPLVLLASLSGWLGRGRQWWRTRLAGLAVTAGVAALIYAPLFAAFLSHPDWFTRRLQAAATYATLLRNVGRTLGGWLWIGGAALHDLPGRPMYDPAMGVLLLTGVAIALWNIRRPAYNVWIVWLACALPGGFLSSPAPVFYRILPAIPPASVLCAIAGWRWYRFVAIRLPRLRNLVLLLLGIIFAVSTWATCHDYFVRWADWPSLPAVMDVSKWRAAETILNAPADETLLVTIPDGLEPAITYALRARQTSPARAFDGAHCLIYPTRNDLTIHYLAIRGYEHRTLDRLPPLFPSGYQTVDPALSGEPYFVNFFVPPGGAIPILGRLDFPIAYSDILLHGVHVTQSVISAGQSLTVTLTWEILRPTRSNYVAFIHLLDGRPEAAGAPLAQNDSVPCDAAEPTWHWQPGEYVLDTHVLVVPPDLPAGEYLMGAGLYDSDTLERLVPAGQGLNVRWDEAIFHTITVTGP